MPPKRKIANISTGGTEDVRPQILSASFEQSVLGQEQVSTFPTPVPRSSFSKDLAQVMEVLSVAFYFHHPASVPVGFMYAVLATTTPGNAVTLAPVTAARARLQVADNRVIAAAMENIDNAGAPGTGSIGVAYPNFVDLRDGVGHGVLVGVDTLFLVQGALATASAIAVTVKIVYRMINVGIMEYVGIVQSQA